MLDDERRRQGKAGLLAAAALLMGSCQAEEPQSGPAPAQGRWERTDGPPRSIRGLQETEALRGAGKVVIVGGVDYDQSGVKAVVFEPSSGRWSHAARSGLWWRSGLSAIAAGSEVILWGGCCGGGGRGSRAVGAVYDIARNEWRRIRPGPLVNLFQHTAVWTGKEMIVWGGFDGKRLRTDGAAYQPRSGRWRRIASAPLAGRRYQAAIWTGSEMIVWGGSKPRAGAGERTLSDGAAYNPERDSWRRLAKTPFRSAPARILGAGLEPDLDAAWTGREMMIWNGARGAVYRPRSNSWHTLPPPPPKLRHWKPTDSAIWTGKQLIVWGGTSSEDQADFIADGAAYDPHQGRWKLVPDAPIAGRDRHVAIWTGEAMLVWGGCCRGSRYHPDGALYRPRMR